MVLLRDRGTLRCRRAGHGSVQTCNLSTVCISERVETGGTQWDLLSAALVPVQEDTPSQRNEVETKEQSRTPDIHLSSLCTHRYICATHTFSKRDGTYLEGALAGDTGTLCLLSLLFSHHDMSRWVNIPPNSGANPCTETFLKIYHPMYFVTAVES